MYPISKQYLHVFLNEVTVLVPVLNEAKHSFALYTPERTRQRWGQAVLFIVSQAYLGCCQVTVGRSLD